jgi:N-formylglutamate deformylase
MKTLPLAISNPHAGLNVPEIVRPLCRLTPQEIAEDGDEGAAAIYDPLRRHVTAFASSTLARAIVDLNREEADRSRDGVIKTHTCWNVPVYHRPPSSDQVEQLLREYHRPYHAELSRFAMADVILAVDCHTMAAAAPPMAPDPGRKRPPVCLGDLGGRSLPSTSMNRLASSFSEAFRCAVAINKPFAGGHITHRHHTEMPWVQLELSRAAFLDPEEKSRRVLQALRRFCERVC